jgi:hypothetical protein
MRLRVGLTGRRPEGLEGEGRLLGDYWKRRVGMEES